MCKRFHECSMMRFPTLMRFLLQISSARFQPRNIHFNSFLHQISDSMKSLLRSDAIRSLLGLLSSDHSIMQNEALVAIVTLLTCGKGWHV